MRLLFPGVSVTSEGGNEDQGETANANKAAKDEGKEQGEQQELLARNLELEQEVAALKQSLAAQTKVQAKAPTSSSDAEMEHKNSDDETRKETVGSPNRAELDRNKRVFGIKIRESLRAIVCGRDRDRKEPPTHNFIFG